MPTVVYTVTDEASLNAAITAMDQGGVDSGSSGFEIDITQSFTLTSDPLAINLIAGKTVDIIGGSNTIDGGSSSDLSGFRGLMVLDGAADISDLTIADTRAQGGAGGSSVSAAGGGGAGLGGGLFVGGQNVVNGTTITTGGTVTLDNVTFSDDRAVGGAGGTQTGGAGYGGGGGMGGAGGAGGSTLIGGGGGGLGGAGGAGESGETGILPHGTSGGASGDGHVGGAYGGGGGGATHAGDTGGGGGVGGTNGGTGATVGNGGFGGGGGGGAGALAGYSGGGGGFGGGGGGGGMGGAGGFGGGAGGSATDNPSGAAGFGGGAGARYVGGGGLGAGGAVFVQYGGVLVVGGGTLAGNSASKGIGGSAQAGDGGAYGSGIFIQGAHQTITLGTSGHTLTVAGVIADQGGSGGSGIGTVAIAGGDVVLSAVNTFTGSLDIAGSATLDLGVTGAGGGGNIGLVGTSATLQIEHGVTVDNTIDTLRHLDVFDAIGITGGTGVYNGAADTLTISGTGGSVVLHLAHPYSQADFSAGTDSSSTGTAVTFAACYCPGTRIDTDRGAMAIERLRRGDRVRCRAGELLPVRWIGRRGYAARFVAANPQLRPVRIRVGALAEGVPARDLLVSPSHAVLVGEALVPAGSLVNGVSVTREPVGDVAYLHVELDRHELILAEGAAAESYVDTGNRGMFHNASTAPDSPGGGEMERVEGGPALAAAWRLVAARAGLMPVATGTLRGFVERVVDGVVEGWVMDTADPGMPVELEITAEGMAPARVLASRYRIDLDHAGMAEGRCGFRHALPAAVTIVQVRRASDGAVVRPLAA